MAGKKKVPERRSSLRPSEKELPERRSGAFRHKNTPVYFLLKKKVIPTDSAVTHLQATLVAALLK
jgi:hypothetical protein